MLNAVQSKDLVSIAADWVELEAATGRSGFCSGSDLSKSTAPAEDPSQELDPLDVDLDFEDPEDLEEEILESHAEDWVLAVREELVYRAELLGDDYPFVLEAGPLYWTLRSRGDAHEIKHTFYHICLLVTGARFGLLDGLTQLDRPVQVMSYLVAARIFGGEAFWMGWPRPDSSAFKAALESCLTLMKSDHVSVGPPPWSFENEKDGGIDVVSWKNFRDQATVRLLIYGQVASGRFDWSSKSVRSYLKKVIWPWQGPHAQHTSIPALFIPWPAYVEINVVDRNRRSAASKSFREWASAERLLHDKDLGLVIDRHRLVELCAEGVHTGRNDEQLFVTELNSWLASARERVIDV